MDGTVLTFTLGLAVVLGIVIGIAPAVQLARVNLSNVLREDSRTGTAGRGARLLRRGLVVSQVALAFVLLIGGGLLLASFQRLLGVNPGFTAEHVMTGRVSPLASRYPDDAALRSYTSRVLERIRALPGIEAAGATTYLPFSWDGSSSVIIAEGYTPAPGESVVSPNQLYVTHGYLEALRVSLKRGRFFTDSDTAESPRVVIVDEQLARKFWPNADPIGRRMYLPDRPEDVVKPGPNTKYLQVVGVVGTVKLKGLIEGENARAGAYYMPFAQSPQRNIGFAVRSRGEAFYHDGRGAARPGGDRPGDASLRRLHDVRTRRQVAEPATRADGAVAGVWPGRAATGLGRLVWRAGVSGESADA